MLKCIEEDHFIPEVIATSKPVLIASLGEGAHQRKQMLLLAKLAGVAGDRCKLLLMKPAQKGLLREKYGIKTSPAFLLFSKGRIKGRHVGAFNYRQLKGFVSKGMSRKACIDDSPCPARARAVDIPMPEYVMDGELDSIGSGY